MYLHCVTGSAAGTVYSQIQMAGFLDIEFFVRSDQQGRRSLRMQTSDQRACRGRRQGQIRFLGCLAGGLGAATRRARGNLQHFTGLQVEAGVRPGLRSGNGKVVVAGRNCSVRFLTATQEDAYRQRHKHASDARQRCSAVHGEPRGSWPTGENYGPISIMLPSALGRTSGLHLASVHLHAKGSQKDYVFPSSKGETCVGW